MDIYKTPLLTARDAARHLGMPESTLDSWLAEEDGIPLVHSLQPERRGWPRVPFVGLVEAYVLRGLRDLGFSKMDIREAAARVRTEFDDHFALASKRIDTDGVDLFLRLADETHIKVKDDQRAFGEVLHRFLKDIHWDSDGRPEALRLARYSTKVNVIIDPRFAWGSPILAETRTPITQVTDLWRAGEPIANVAAEFDLSPDVVEDICRAAA